MANKFTDGKLRKFSDGGMYCAVYTQPGEYEIRQLETDEFGRESLAYVIRFSGVKSSPDLIRRLEDCIRRWEQARLDAEREEWEYETYGA